MPSKATQPETECARAWPVLEVGVRKLGLEITDQQRDQLISYCDLLQAANARTNLTALRTPELMMRGLLLDSLAMVPTLRSLLGTLGSEVTLTDVGTGAGIPGLPLKIMFPTWQTFLIESTRKKAEFVRSAIEHLGLSSIKVLPHRAEEVGRSQELRDRSDLVVARAVAGLASLVELCGPLARPGGWLVLPKGEESDLEISASREAAERLNLELASVDEIPADLGLGEHRKLVVYRKLGPTPTGYPRRVGLAQSRPIGTARDARR